MALTDTTWTGPEISDPVILDRIPAELRPILEETNGFIYRHGALHVRGACESPAWHSLRAAMEGDHAFHVLYDAVDEADVPFAQDCVGDQFILRGGHVLRLNAETGDVEGAAIDLADFFRELTKDPLEFLRFNPETKLQPGELLYAYPPFCMKESGAGTSLKPCPASEVILFHAELAHKIADIPEGGKLRIRVSE